MFAGTVANVAKKPGTISRDINENCGASWSCTPLQTVEFAPAHGVRQGHRDRSAETGDEGFRWGHAKLPATCSPAMSQPWPRLSLSHQYVDVGDEAILLTT